MKNTFHDLQYAQAKLLLAEQKKDDAEVQKWRVLVVYWQRLYQAQKRRRLLD